MDMLCKTPCIQWNVSEHEINNETLQEHELSVEDLKIMYFAATV